MADQCIIDMGGDGSHTPPGGSPIPGVTNAHDVEWALTKARRFIFRGGDRTDPRYRAYIDRWLDYALTLGGRIGRDE